MSGTLGRTANSSEVLAHKVPDNPDTAYIEEGIRIKPAINVGMLVYPTLPHHANTCHAQLEKDGVHIALTIDTPRAGDNIDNEFGFVVLSVLPDLV